MKNSTDSILSSLAVSVPAGESRVNLNFSVPADSSLKLGVSSFTGFSTNQGLYRNDNSAIYPYEIPGLLSITGTTAGASYYYYLYDWEILTENGTCTSPRV